MGGIQILIFCNSTVLYLSLHFLQNVPIKHCNLRQNILINSCCLWLTSQFNKLQSFNMQLPSEGSCVAWLKNCNGVVAKKDCSRNKRQLTANSWKIIGLVQVVYLSVKSLPQFHRHRHTHIHTHTQYLHYCAMPKTPNRPHVLKEEQRSFDEEKDQPYRLLN